MAEKTSSVPTLESLQGQVDQLTKLVEKQNKIILSTGEKLMQMQVEQQKAKHKDLETSKSSIVESSDDFVTNEDIVQLVGELQGQLLALDYKSFARVANSNKGIKEPLEIVPNHDGEFPAEKIYPLNKLDFKTFSDTKVFVLAKFYELIPDFRDAEVDEICLKHFNELSISPAETELLTKEAELWLPEKSNRSDLYNKLAIYLGVETRKEKEAN